MAWAVSSWNVSALYIPEVYMEPCSVGTKSFLGKVCGTHICYLLENRKIDRDLPGPCVGRDRIQEYDVPMTKRKIPSLCQHSPGPHFDVVFRPRGLIRQCACAAELRAGLAAHQ